MSKIKLHKKKLEKARIRVEKITKFLGEEIGIQLEIHNKSRLMHDWDLHCDLDHAFNQAVILESELEDIVKKIQSKS